MKKTILAIAIPALFASAANAAVIYDKDGTTFDVYGRVQANYYGEANDKSAELVGATRLGWSGKVALNNTWSAIAKTEWQVAAENSGSNTSDIDPRHIYAGFDGSQYGKIIFGQTDTAFYDVLEPTDIFNEWGDAGNFYDGRQEGQIIYSNTFGGFKGKVSYQTNDDVAVKITDVGQKIKEDAIWGKDVKRKKAYGVAAGYDFDFGLGFNAGYAYSDLQNKVNGHTGKKDEWAVGAHYAINGFYFAGVYTEGEVKNKSLGMKDDGRGYELAASYNVDAWTFLAGYNFKEGKANAQAAGSTYKDLVDETLLGVQYAFTPKLKAYTEYKIQGIDKQDDEWTVALQYNF
ncbi:MULTISPECIES: porin [Aeromonas]|uniref:Outer membrane protein Aha1 n=7 Tax=Aeromonas TaxID=642 RepID=I3QPU2_AERSO|nr:MULTISPECIES: porin [Aeromonas]AFK13792.1 outer membrane protein Aha1 [Aeromonas sobria]AFK13793.1 outer membrane protein Aha1 [Aeromonas sobria]AXV18916.1 porin [Aeromonas veronii]AYV37753.1 porin [Aeromonas veronii]EKP0246544.1 porin [Aeromonas veronii]